MANISSFVYCDSIQQNMTSNGPRQEIVHPLQVLSPFAIPSNFSFAVSCNVAGFDRQKENTFRMQFVSPSGEIVYDTSDIKFKIPAETLQKENPTVMQFNLDLRNLVLKEEGTYSTKVFFNSDLLDEFKIEVRKAINSQ